MAVGVGVNACVSRCRVAWSLLAACCACAVRGGLLAWSLELGALANSGDGLAWTRVNRNRSFSNCTADFF
jgi:hypothetical protein